MARGSTVCTLGGGTLAAYKAMYQPVSVILNQASPRTSDTGQVNWATIATEPTGVRDFEIFAMGGALQATAPIFLRVDYQGGTSVTNNLFLTVGSTTDGAGNLGGVTVAKGPLVGSSPGSGDRFAWAACDGTYFTLIMLANTAGTGADGTAMFVVERTRDGAGAATGEGFHVWRWQRTANTTTFQGGVSRVFAAAVQPAFADFNVGVNIPDLNNTNSAFIGGVSKAFPASTYVSQRAGGASKALMFAFPNDFPRQRQVTMSFYGEMQTWIPLSDAVTQLLPTMSAATTTATRAMSPLIRWD